MQLGLGTPASVDDFAAVETPRRVLLDVKTRQVACGNRHTVALSVNGDVYGFGAGEEGQLGSCPAALPTHAHILSRAAATLTGDRDVCAGTGQTAATFVPVKIDALENKVGVAVNPPQSLPVPR